MLSWPSSQRIRYRGEGSPRNSSSTTPDRGRRSVDSDSATTRLPTSKAMLTPSLFVLVEDSRHRSSATTTARRRLWKTWPFLASCSALVRSRTRSTATSSRRKRQAERRRPFTCGWSQRAGPQPSRYRRMCGNRTTVGRLTTTTASSLRRRSHAERTSCKRPTRSSARDCFRAGEAT
jgi:hypothetical protein